VKVQIVYLSSADDANSTRDMLGWVQATRVLLVWPDHGKILTDRLELVKIQRFAKQRNLQIGLLTFDSDVRQNAQELSFPIFDSLEDLPESKWEIKTPKSIQDSEEALSRYTSPPVQQLKERMPAWVENIRSRNIRLPAALIFGISLLLLIIIVPSAVIDLSPTGTGKFLPISVDLYSEADLESELGKIRVEKYRVDVVGSATISTSGWTRVPKSPAQGVAIFENHTEDPINIPSHTVLWTSGSIEQKFRTTTTAELLGGFGAKVEIAVEAITSGAEGNVPANSISAIEGPLGLLISVSNPRALKGGVDEIHPTATQSDLDDVEEQLLEELFLLASSEIGSNLQEKLVIVEDGIWLERVIDQEYNHKPGEIANELTMEMEVSVVMLVYHELDLERLILNEMSQDLPVGVEVIPTSLSYEVQTEPPGLTDGRWGLGIQAEVETYDTLDFRDVKTMIFGRTPESALRILRDTTPHLIGSKITLYPSWMPILPFWTERIQLHWDWE
jgi:hypothetical protein